MRSAPSVASPLPVSILAGPSVGSLLHGIVASDSDSRFILLAHAGSTEFTSLAANQRFHIEPLPMSKNGSPDLGRLREQIAELAAKQIAEHLIIECDSRTHPIAFASLFLPDPHGHSLAPMAHLNSIITAIEGGSLVKSMLHGELAPGIVSSCILADQIESATTIALENENIDYGTRALAIVTALNSAAEFVDMKGAELVQVKTAAPWRLPVTDEPFDFERAFAGTGWRKVLDEPLIARTYEGSTKFSYQARRPFHPERFWRQSQIRVPGLFRAKGFFWLASRMEMVGGLSIAGSECHLSPAGRWWAASRQGEHSSDSAMPDQIRKEWEEPFGDRRQAIAFMGCELDHAKITRQLDACLLSDAEVAQGEQNWAALTDPFPDWSMSGHHHHDCDDHDCGCH